MSDDYDLILERAEAGFVDAQKELAYLCLSEENRVKNRILSQACIWWRSIATTMDGEAFYMIGFFYLNGIGKPANAFLAEQWFNKANACNIYTAAQQLKAYYKNEDVKFPEDVFKAIGEGLVRIEDPEMSFEDDDQKINEQAFTIDNLAIVFNDEGKPIIDVKGTWVQTGASNSNASPITSDSGNGDSSDWQDDYDAFLYKGRGLEVIRPDFDTSPFEKLDALIGLDHVKSHIRNIQHRMTFDLLRKEHELSTSSSSNHFIFSGNPGTGKNEVARVLGYALFVSGVLEQGHVVEVDQGNLVAAYAGQTALKTKAAIKKAKGGVLFIDEAYMLDPAYAGGYGDEVLSTLMKAMEDKRQDFVVVMAGYKDEMSFLMKSNPGLKSRFRHHLEFDDYTARELSDIYASFAETAGYEVTDDADSALVKLMQDALDMNDRFFGNGRFARNAFEKTIEKLAARVLKIETPQKEDLQRVMFCDVPSLDDVLGKIVKPQKFSGNITRL